MTSWPDLTALELLVALSEHASLSGAARALDMAQPNASRSLGRLERHLGLPLVIRSPRGTELTPQGVLVVEWSRPVLAAAQQWRQGTLSLRAGGSQTLAVAASHTIAEHLLPSWVSRLYQSRPGVHLDIHIANSQQVVRRLLDGHCALGFVEGPHLPRGVHHTVIGRDELVVVTAPHHPWARRRTPLLASELAATALVTREAASGTRRTLEAALAPLTPVPPVLELASAAAIRASVIAATAPAVLSRLAVTDALAAGTLTEIPLADLCLIRELKAVWTGPARLRGGAGALVDIAKQAARRPPAAQS